MAAPAQFALPANTGDSDVSPDNTPSQYLLFRGLESTVSEEVLAKGATKLYRANDAPTTEETNSFSATTKITSTSKVANAGARHRCIRRILLVRDRRTGESWRYGFVEFAAVEDAQAAMAKYLSLERFTIASKPVIVSYIHAGVFIPYLYPKPEDEKFTFSASTNPALKLGYWDAAGYINVLVVSTGREDARRDAAAAKAKLKASKDDASKPKKRKADPNSTEAPDAKPKKQMASHLQFWTQRGQELRGGVKPDPPKDDPPATMPSTTVPPTQSYADPNKNCCYLCARQFKSAAEVNKHERLSDLHQTNLKNEESVAKARARLEKEGIALVDAAATSGGGDDEDGPTQEYRDRARERRKAFNPGKAKPGQAGTEAKVGTGKSKADDEPAQPQQSKAAAMLMKMGHVEGQGLGSSGTGSTAPIETNLYAAGVGLGAQGGNRGDAVEEASKATKGDYGDFVKDVREKARERFARES